MNVEEIEDKRNEFYNLDTNKLTLNFMVEVEENFSKRRTKIIKEKLNLKRIGNSLNMRINNVTNNFIDFDVIDSSLEHLTNIYNHAIFTNVINANNIDSKLKLLTDIRRETTKTNIDEKKMLMIINKYGDLILIFCNMLDASKDDEISLNILWIINNLLVHLQKCKVAHNLKDSFDLLVKYHNIKFNQNFCIGYEKDLIEKIFYIFGNLSLIQPNLLVEYFKSNTNLIQTLINSLINSHKIASDRFSAFWCLNKIINVLYKEDLNLLLSAIDLFMKDIDNFSDYLFKISSDSDYDELNEYLELINEITRINNNFFILLFSSINKNIKLLSLCYQTCYNLSINSKLTKNCIKFISNILSLPNLDTDNKFILITFTFNQSSVISYYNLILESINDKFNKSSSLVKDILHFYLIISYLSPKYINKMIPYKIIINNKEKEILKISLHLYYKLWYYSNDKKINEIFEILKNLFPLLNYLKEEPIIMIIIVDLLLYYINEMKLINEMNDWIKNEIKSLIKDNFNEYTIVRCYNIINYLINVIKIS